MGRIRSMQACFATQRTALIRVPSSSKENVEYTVKVVVRDGTVTCTCPGFNYRGTCRHTEFSTDPCGWHEAFSPERQTMSQKRQRICPRCSSRTVDVMFGSAQETEEEELG